MNRAYTLDSQYFSDEKGRHVLFNGLNLVCKDPSLGYVYPLTLSCYQRLYQHGINVLRFGLNWSIAAPSPGVYNDEYLQRVKEQLRFASDAGLCFFLDFHQDLYGVSFGNGAPGWAEVTDGLPHATGDLWSDAYLISPALNRAIQLFWANDPVCGIGLQDHFADMVEHIARFFCDTPGLLGYDLWNEPYPGPDGQDALNAALELLPAGASGQLEQAEEKARLIASLTDMDFYKRLTNVLSEKTIHFEKAVLMPFYEKIAQTIHKADPHALLFTEPCYFTNMGVPSGIEKLSVPGQVFAPHGYDLIVDTGYDDLYDPRRIDLIFQRHRESGERLALPIFIGEWGAFEGRAGNDQAAEQMIQIIEDNLWSHTYWSWSEDMESRPEWRQLVRAYPIATAGTLESYHWDGKSLSLNYCGVPGTTEIFIPNLGQGCWDIRALQGNVQFEKHLWPDTGHGILSATSESYQPVCLQIGRRYL